MEPYLSIGEVSKLKGVSVKSLRYYDKLGIFPPAYINPETGYRYYSVDQLVVLDLIVVCLNLGIELRQFQNYQDPEHGVDIRRLLADGRELVRQKERQLHNNILFLEAMEQHVLRTNRIKDRNTPFFQQMRPRHMLTWEWNGDLDDQRQILAGYTALYQQCALQHISDTFNQGVLWQRTGEVWQHKIFLEIPQPVEGAWNQLTIPGGRFACQVLRRLPDQPLPESADFVLLTELFDVRIQPAACLLEWQQGPL